MAAKHLNNIFLSASIPYEERHRVYIDTADIIAIRDSVRALATVVLPRAHLVWGGHPSINPMIRYVLERMEKKAKDHVTLYLSEFFRPIFPPDIEDFETVVFTANLGEREPSLELMRREMFRNNVFKAAIFIGGMEGIENEYKLFKEYHPTALTLPVASTGAAAKILYDGFKIKPDKRLLDDYAYMALFKDLLGQIIQQ